MSVTNVFAGMKAGDRVWVSDGYGGKRIASVLGSTKTLVRVTNSIGNPMNFRVVQWKHDDTWHAYESPQRMFGETLVGPATPQQCENWDKEQADKSAELDRSHAAKVKADAMLEELNALVHSGELTNTGSITVTNATWGSREERSGRFDVTFHGLTEQQVRELAKIASAEPTERIESRVV